MAIAIAAVYFGVRPHSWLTALIVYGPLALVLIATIPQRMGVVIALHYLSRRYWPDADDPIPPLAAEAR